MERELPYMPRKTDGVEPPDNWYMLLFKDLMPYARKRTPCDADAEDLAQEVVIKAGRNIEKLRDAPNMRAWLLLTMRNQLKDDKRKQKRQVPTVPLVADAQVLDVPELLRTPDPDHWLMGLMQRATGKRKDFAMLAVEEEFDEHRIALRLRELPEYADRPIQKLEHKARRKFQDLQDWAWAYLGLLPEVKAHLAYEKDPTYAEFPMPLWRDNLEEQARLIVESRNECYADDERDTPDVWSEKASIEGWRLKRECRVLLWDDAELRQWGPWHKDLIHWHLEQDMKRLLGSPHLIARASEFNALNEFDRAMRMPKGRFIRLWNAIKCIEQAMDFFFREKLNDHAERVADHHKRIESLLKKAPQDEVIEQEHVTRWFSRKRIGWDLKVGPRVPEMPPPDGEGGP